MSHSSSQAAAFAPYTPPPDQLRGSDYETKPSSSGAAHNVGGYRTSYDADADADEDEDDDPRYATESYQQASRRPLMGSSSLSSSDPYSPSPSHSGPPRLPTGSGSGPAGPTYGRPVSVSEFATSAGSSAASLCGLAWMAPPFTSTYILVFETENDLARFHAYQSGLAGVLLILALWILRSWFAWYAISWIVGMAGLGFFWVSASNAARAAPTLAKVPYLPQLGDLADRWVGEE